MGTNNVVFLEVIEWFDESGKELVHRIPEEGSGEIKWGACRVLRSLRPPLEPKPEVRKCPRCKAENPPEATFCNQCGQRLQRSDPTGRIRSERIPPRLAAEESNKNEGG